MHNICDYAQRIFVDHKGWVKLLDMDNIICQYDNKLEVVEIENCPYCEYFEWSGLLSDADRWEQRQLQELIDNAIKQQYESEDYREQESYM